MTQKSQTHNPKHCLKRVKMTRKQRTELARGTNYFDRTSVSRWACGFRSNELSSHGQQGRRRLESPSGDLLGDPADLEEYPAGLHDGHQTPGKSLPFAHSGCQGPCRDGLAREYARPYSSTRVLASFAQYEQASMQLRSRDPTRSHRSETVVTEADLLVRRCSFYSPSSLLLASIWRQLNFKLKKKNTQIITKRQTHNMRRQSKITTGQ